MVRRRHLYGKSLPLSVKRLAIQKTLMQQLLGCLLSVHPLIKGMNARSSPLATLDNLFFMIPYE